MVPLDDDASADPADAPEPAWLDSLGLWREGLDQATRPDVRRMVVSRLDPPLSRRLTGEMEIISMPGVDAPDAPESDWPDQPRRPGVDGYHEDLPLENPPRDHSPVLPTTPMLSMTSGRTPTTSGGTPVVDADLIDLLGPTGRVVRPQPRRTQAQRAASRRSRRLGRLAVAAGLVLALAFAWFVLVAARDPSTNPGGAPEDRAGARIDQVLVGNLLADRLQALVGWVASVSTTLVLGGLIFQLFVAGARALPQARSPRSATGYSAGLAVLRKAAIVGILAELVCLLLRAAAMSSDGFAAMGDADTLLFVMAGRFGDAAFVRIAGLALLAGFLPVLPIGPASRRPGSGGRGRGYGARGRNGNDRRNGHADHSREVLHRGAIYPRRLGAAVAGADRMLLERLICVVGGLVILLSYAIVGHPQATRPAVLFVPIQCIHLVAVSTWFGGVAFLAIELRHQKREGTARDFAEVVRRFSTVAGVTIAVAGLTGLAMASTQLDSLDALRETAYGRALMVKVAVLAIPVAIGAYNRHRVVPAIVNRDEPSAWRHLRITLVLETMFIAMGVLLATAAMTSGGFQ